MSETSAPSSKTLVIIPTYNELENLPLIVGRLHRAQPGVDVLVVDDNSPDGTGDLADSLAAEDPRIHVLHRAEKNGLGGAYIAGFKWALERDYRPRVRVFSLGPQAVPPALVKGPVPPAGAAAWICRGTHCLPPVATLEEIVAALGN